MTHHTPPTERWRVPSLVALQAMDNDELRDTLARCEQSIADCSAAMEHPRDARHLGSINKALLSYRAGVSLIGNIRALREGKPLFVRARPVSDFKSATQSLKAVNRLLGLLYEEHVAAVRLRHRTSVAGTPEWDAWKHAFDMVQAALGAPAEIPGASGSAPGERGAGGSSAVPPAPALNVSTIAGHVNVTAEFLRQAEDERRAVMGEYAEPGAFESALAEVLAPRADGGAS